MAAIGSSEDPTGGPGGGGSCGSEQAPAPDLPEVSRIHILPIGEVDVAACPMARLEALAPALKRLRTSGEAITAGDVLREGSLDFAVIKCEPPVGRLGRDTDYHFEGCPVLRLEKVQFSAWGPEEDMPPDDVFKDVLAPHFRKPEHRPYSEGTSEKVEFLYCNQMFQIGDINFQVEASEPSGLGVVTSGTEFFVSWDSTPEFDKVHIVPFQDTLPRAYEYDIFQDYLKPFLKCNQHKKFVANELFTYHGVEFKLVAADPTATARIGKRTTIYCDGVLHPNLRNLLPPELLSQVQQLPRGLQMLLLSQERTTRELEDMLTQRRGLFDETLQQIERFTWPPQDNQGSTQTTCMICLGDFSVEEPCRRLPCRHVFHSDCVDEWLRRCTDCPICKSNVDRAIRHY